jgi:hypothetical protein
VLATLLYFEADLSVADWPLYIKMIPAYYDTLEKRHVQEMWTEGRLLLPHTQDELRARFAAAIANITKDILQSVWQEIVYRWDVCRARDGANWEVFRI